jgi:hypothetical protein
VGDSLSPQPQVELSKKCKKTFKYEDGYDTIMENFVTYLGAIFIV